jgi:hypothetical protein
MIMTLIYHSPQREATLKTNEQYKFVNQPDRHGKGKRNNLESDLPCMVTHYGRVTCSRMKPQGDELTGVLSWP